MQEQAQSLEFQLGERDVEMDRMKTTLIALNEKLSVTNDIKLDCEQHKDYWGTSEEERKKLQSQILQTSRKMIQD